MSRNVLVLGGSYSGARAAEVLSKTLPPSHRVILVDKTTHFNHLYNFPRYGVVSGHEHKAFIPYTNLLQVPTPQHVPSDPLSSENPVPEIEKLSVQSSPSQAPSTSAMSSRSPSPDRSHVSSRLPVYLSNEASRSSLLSNTSTWTSSNSEGYRDGGEGESDRESASTAPSSYSSTYDLRADANFSEEKTTTMAEKKTDEQLPDQYYNLSPPDSEPSSASLSRAANGPNHSHVLHGLVTKISKDHVEVEVASLDCLDKDGDEPEIHESHGRLEMRRTRTATLENTIKREKTKRVVKIDYEYLVYALGSALPKPIHSSALTKYEGIDFLRNQQLQIQEADSIVIVGGGALGIQYACDIAEHYGTVKNPTGDVEVMEGGEKIVKGTEKDLGRAEEMVCDESVRDSELPDPSAVPSGQGSDVDPASSSRSSRRPKRVTLIHSRDRLLPIFDVKVHEEAKKRMEELGVEVVWGQRVQVSQQDGGEAKGKGKGKESVRTADGRVWEADLVVMCTGQKPNSQLLASQSPGSVDQWGFIKVDDKMRVVIDDYPSGKLFAVGDCAAAGSIKAGHTGWNQADVAAANILKLVEAEKTRDEADEVVEEEGSVELDTYTPSKPMIKLTLGLTRSVSQLVSQDDPEKLVITVNDSPSVDLGWEHLWRRMNLGIEDPML